MFFKGEYDFLSNFYASPIQTKNYKFKTVEHAYQASKANNDADKLMIINADTPGQAKKLGRSIVVRDDWEKIKVKTMFFFVYFKFNQNPHLLDKLFSVNVPIVENNLWHDNFWGICTCMTCYGKPKHNVLGNILTTVKEKYNEILWW